MSNAKSLPYHPAVTHVNESERLTALYKLQILDTAPEPRFDRLTELAADVLNVPIALISLVDKNRQWFKSSCGFAATQTPREQAFCSHALHCDDIMLVDDTLTDERFRHNPLVTGEPFVRFYAGAVLHSPEGLPLGTLCLIDTQPRTFSKKEQRQLIAFARLVQAEMNQDITDAQSRMRSQLSAHLDPMTGFFNYAEFCDRCEAILNAQDDKGQGALLFISLPQLDFIYRVHGLEIYQSVIGPVAQILVRAFADEETLFGRQLREGLLVFIKGNQQPLEELAKKAQQALRDEIQLPSSVPDLAIRIGVARVTNNIDQTTHHCKAAARSMLQEKGIRYNIFSDEDISAENRASDIALRLLHAIEEDELNLHFQPKVSVSTGHMLGAEALLRWSDDKLGEVPPGEVVNAAVSADLVTVLDNWVLATAIKQIAYWQTAGLEPVPISINLGAESFAEPALPSRIQKLLTTYNVPAELLQIEVLETAILHDFDSILPIMQAITQIGVQFALDDFGTEYSSLRYLQRLPISVVKIDRSFVQGLVANQEDAALAMGIISIAHDLGMEVIAEGVENREQYVVLRSFQCDGIQGNLFRAACSGDEIADYLLPNFSFPLPAFHQ
jgi:EAL domain-containing protein (putative c-di-GMP-specific phosphodiesterase class I)/GGDEF domain-containing protein